jgi:hypothetical protein
MSSASAGCSDVAEIRERILRVTLLLLEQQRGQRVRAK